MLDEIQLKQRTRGIGGSDVPIILGMANYKTAVQLWLEKRGEVEPENIDDRENIIMGNLLEPVVVTRFEMEMERLGNPLKCREANTTTNPDGSKGRTRFATDPPWMLGNVDRKIVANPWGFEAKAWSTFSRDQWGTSGTGEVPVAVVAQCAHYMHVFEWVKFYIGVLLGSEFRWFVLERDEDVIKTMIDIEGEFWNHVQQGTMPAAVELADVVRLYKQSRGTVRATSEITGKVVELLDVKARRKKAEEEESALKFEIGQFMGEAGSLFPPEGVDGINPICTFNSAKESVKVDYLKAYGKLALAYRQLATAPRTG